MSTIRLKGIKWLICGAYHPPSEKDEYFLNFLTNAIDYYNQYQNLLIVGDFIIQETEVVLKKIIDAFDAKNLIKNPTCFKSMDNPTTI